MNIVVNDGIVVSGVGVPLNGIAWPSGQFGDSEPGSQLCAFLSSINATFGFNLTPHRFQTEWVPCGNACDFHGASGQLPNIGHPIEVFVGDFFVRGNITHADYTSTVGGTIVNVTIEDDRRTLRRAKIHTEDLGEDVPSGIVSIARAFRKVNGLNNDALIKEYERILQFGGTYEQVLSAIDFSFSEGKCAFPVNDFPTAIQIGKNLDGASDSIRFQFNLSPLDEAMSRMLQDAGYDWYWGMDNQRLNLINKKVEFDITEPQILDLVSTFGSASGLNETRQLGFGQDVVPEPTRFRVLGGHQEGFINSKQLSPIDGLDTAGIDGHTSTNPDSNLFGDLVFTKVWDQITVGFFDADGFYRTYVPCEKELEMALAGIEAWAYFKLYQTNAANDNPPGFDEDPDEGSIAAQHPTFQSRFDPLMPLAGLATGAAESGIRVISNRRDEEHNWVLAFFNRIQSHATRHYGRSFILEGLLFDQDRGFFRLINAAWANVENQVQGYALSPSGTTGVSGVFVQDYEIDRDLGPVSPFLTDDFRVAAHAVLPKGTVYGPQGDDTPASFGNWTEDAKPFNPQGNGDHYIPVDLTVVGQRVKDPRNDDLYGFESFPEGTLWCQLPISAGQGLVEDETIASLATLLTTNQKLSSSGIFDIQNPAMNLDVYRAMSGVAIPVQARSRYGQDYPSEWYLGNLHYERDEDVQLDDQFVPWAFSPEGSKTSLQQMTDRAIRRVQGKIVPKSSSRYGDFTQIGLPLLSFDAFAEQGIGPSGQFGEITHGVNEVNISFGDTGFVTRYKIVSYFPQFGKEAPLGERIRGILNGILNPIDFTDLDLLNNKPGTPIDPSLPGDTFIPPAFFDDEQRAVRVQITEVNNVFTLSSTPGSEEDERYRGLDTNKYTKPPKSIGSSNKDISEGAICIDGFLNIDDEALYHTDDFSLPGGNVVSRYFSQGRSFGNGTIVEVSRRNADDSSKYDVTIVDGGGVGRALFGLEVLNGTVEIGDRTTLAVQGDGSVKPGAGLTGVFLNGTTAAGAGVTPVEVVAVGNIGSEFATVTCQPLDYQGNVISSGEFFGATVPIPYAQFAASGDRGYLASLTVPSGEFGGTARVNFVDISKPAFFTFGNLF
jgi:hypothetical protein